MMPLRYLILSLLCCLGFAVAEASNLKFRMQHFSSELPQGNVLAIEQDRHGYIYMATRNGLCRYDGKSFRNFKSYPFDDCILSTNRIDQCFVSVNNYIWCITNDHRCFLFDPKQEKFFDPLKALSADNGESLSTEWIYPLENGVTWIACKGAAFRVEEQQLDENFTGGGITRYEIGKKGIPGRRVEKIRLDAEGNEWLLTNLTVRCLGATRHTPQRGLSYICPTDSAVWIAEHHGRISRYDRGAEHPVMTHMPTIYGTVRNIQQIGRDTLGISTDRGLTLYDAAQEHFQHIPVPGGDLNVFHRDSRNNLWIFTNAEGVFRYHLPSGEMEHLRTPDNQLPNADQGSMIFWHEDSNGNIFLTPHSGTFCRYNPESRKLELLQSESNEPYCRSTRRYCVDKQENIWIAETIGATCLTPYRQTPKPIAITESDTKALLIDRHDRIWMTSRDHTICLFDQQERLLGYLGRDGRLHRERTLFDAAIYCLHEDEDGTIWMGSLNDGLFRLTEKSPQHYHIDQFTHDPHDSYSLSDNRIYDICRDHRGRLWIGSYNGGLNLVEGEKGDRPRFFHDLNRLRYPQPAFDQIRTFEEIGDWLFIGTTRGLVIYSTDFDEPEQATYYTYQTSALEGNSFPSNDIHDIHYTSSGEIYLLAFSGGLSRVIPEKSTPEHLFCETLTSKDGLPSEQVLAMIEEPNTGAQWLETETGLFRFDSSKRRVERFATQYRSQDYIFSEAKPLLRNNQMYVGTTNGLYSIPIDAQDSHFIPPLRLTEIRIKGEVRTCGVDQLRRIDLQSDERNLYLAFAALDYTNPSAIHYAYRIRNVKESWNEVSDWQMLKSQNYVHFMHLEPGDYAIEIRSTNSEGQWIDDTLSLSLSVAPTFWETGWAWLFYAVVLLLVILIPVTILYLRGKIAMEQRLSATKLRFYTNISHELRTPLTLITAPIDLLLRREQLTEEGRRELAIVRRNTQRLIHTINQILDFRKIENLKMRLLLEQGDLLPLVRHTMSHFDLQAEEHRIDYRLRCDEEQLPGWFDRDKLEKILFNLLSNAFKYTPDGRSIQVCLATRQGVLQLQVIDQGEGMDEVTKKRIFARFETLMRANLFKPSSGIGLSLVHELTLLHGGSIEVDSEVGRGSCFTVTLPINQEAFAAMNHVDFLMDDQTASAVSNDLPAATTLSEVETATPQQDNTPHTEEVSERWSILLVEDNDELRTMMRNILSTEYTVFEAANGEEGLAIAREQLPHMVISDIMMPRMDGLEMVQKIKEESNTSHALILLLSAKSSLDDRIQGLEQGVDDYIPKPFHASYLLARIHSLIARRQELQQQLLAQMVAVDITQTNTEEYITPELLFMRKATAVIEAHLDNCEWSIDDFASEMCLSSPALYRKLRAVVDLSPVEFVREVRLKKACQLIRERHHSIAAISDMVGFSDPKYFTRVFKKRFGIPPSQYHETLTLPEGISEPQ